MVNRVLASGRVTGGDVRGVSVTVGGQRFTGQDFRTRLRRGEFGGRIAGFGGTGRQAQDRAIKEAINRDVTRARVLINKSEKGLAALTKSEQIELETIIKKVGSTRTKPTFSRISGLSRPEQLRELERGRLEAEAKKRETEKLALDLRKETLNAKQKTLEKLAQRGLLQSGVAVNFNNQIQRLNSDVKTFNAKIFFTKNEISKFNRKKNGQIVKVSPTATEKLEIVREFKARVSQNETIEPLGFSMERVRATRKLGGDIGAGISPRGLEVFGFRGGAAVGSTLGLLEESARFAVDVPLFGIEKFLGKPIALELKEDDPKIRRFKQQIGFFPAFFPSQRQIIKGSALIPFFGDIIGAKQAVTPEGKVVFTRAALRDFGTSLALFFGPQAIVKTAKVVARAKVPVQSFLAGKLKIPKPTLKFTAPTLEQRIPTPDELKIAQIRSRRLKTIREVQESFASVQKKATQQEITRLLGEPASGIITKPSKAGIKFGQINLPKVKFQPPKKPVEAAVRKTRPKKTFVLGPAKPKQVKFVFLDERGQFFPTGGFQIPKPFGPIRITVGKRVTRRFKVVRFKDLFKQFDIKTAKPRTGTRLRLAAFGTALSQKQLEQSITFPLQALRDTTGFAELQRARELEKFKTISFTTTIQKQIESQLERQKELEKIKTPTRTRLKTGLKIPPLKTIDLLTPKTKIPRRPRIVLLPFLEEEKEELSFFDRRKEGFHTFIRKKGRATRVNKVPLVEQSAKGLLFLLADQSVRRSGFIKRAKRKGKNVPPLNVLSGLLRNKFRRPKGKTKLVQNSFVERSMFAIDTAQELQGITLKGRIASERNRAIRKVLKTPKKRIKLVRKFKNRSRIVMKKRRAKVARKFTKKSRRQRL